MAKKEVVPGLAAEPGRFWGAMGRAKLPAVQAEEIPITEDQAHRLRRTLRGYRKSTTPPEKRGKFRFPKEREFTVSLFCDADFWNTRLPALLEIPTIPLMIDILFSDRIIWGEQELRRRSHGSAVDSTTQPAHLPAVKSLLEIEEAIAELPADARRQLVHDLPALCPDAFPADGWDMLLRDSTPRPALTLLIDQLDAEYRKKPDSFVALNAKSLGKK